MHIYRWDLDRTYLDTDIHSVRGLLRAAVEPASQKQNIPGSGALLRNLVRKDPGCRVVILSGSPTQMREVLAEKLALDGVRVDRLVLKDSLGSIRRGRFRAVTGQVGFKLPQLLKQRVGLGPRVHETLFGDDSEVDALVYTVYADAISGRLRENEVARIMEAGGAYSDAIQDGIKALRKIGRADAVDDIFIHCDRGVRVSQFNKLGARVIPIFSWFQAAVVLWERGRLDTPGLENVARAVTEKGKLDERALGGLIQDLVRRRLITPERVAVLLDDSTTLGSTRGPIERSLKHLGEPPPPPDYPRTPEYLGFLRSLKEKKAKS